MSRIEIRLLAGFRCDKRGCSAELRLPEQTFFQALDDQDRSAAVAGWSCWAHSRGRRIYCPDHWPTSPDTMLRVF